MSEPGESELASGAPAERFGARQGDRRDGSRGSRRATDTSPASLSELGRLRARLHDTTLQTLEFIASGGRKDAAIDSRRLMTEAAREAAALREFLEGWGSGEEDAIEDALRQLVQEERERVDHSIELVLGPTDGSVCGMRATELLSAVREALTNVRKHARCQSVVVYCEFRAGGALVSVKDDGVGADLERASCRMGVRWSLRERMARIGGNVGLRSAPGQGTCVSLTLPETS